MRRPFVLITLLAAVFTTAVSAQDGVRTLQTRVDPNAPPPAAAPKAPEKAAPAKAAPTPKAAPAKGGKADLVDVTADTSAGYARLLFKWPSPVGHTASLENGVLIVTFDRPFRLPPTKASLPLDDFVSLIKQDAGGKTMRLSLTQKVRLHESSAGPFVAIDLVPVKFRGDPPDVVDPNARPVGPKAPVDVKMTIGVHEDMTRLVFDWSEVVPYEIKRGDGKVHVEFAREGKFSVDRLNKNPPAWVRSALVSAGDDKTLLDIAIDPSSEVKDSRLKTKVVLDVMAPRNDADTDDIGIVVPEEMVPEPDKKPKDAHAEDGHGAAPKPDEHAADKPKNAHGEDAKPDTPAKDDHAKDEHAGDSKPDAHAKDEAKAGHGEESKPDEHATDEPKGEAKDAKKDDHAAAPAAHGEAKPEEHAKADPHKDAKPAAHDEPKKDDGHGEDSHAEAPHDDHAADAHAPAGEAPEFKAVRTRDALTLTLPVSTSRGAAMFVRNDHAFIVYEGSGAIDVDAIVKTNKDIVDSADLKSAKGVTTLILKLDRPQKITALQSGGGWAAALGDDAQATPRPIVLLRDEQVAGSPSVRATLERATRIVDVTDPSTGEAIIVALASGEPQGVISARGYVEFSADATAQGLAIRTFADDVTVTPGDHDVEITTAAGLILSAGTVTDYAPHREGIGDPMRPAAMDFAAWAHDGDFLKARSELLAQAGGEGEEAEAGRLALARFYLARDLGAEALGQLQLILHQDESVISDPAFRAMRAAALILLDRFQAAQEDLSVSSLDDDPSAQLLRGVAAAGLGQWSQAREAVKRGEGAIKDFRPDWQMRFRIAGARGAIQTNAADIADAMLKAAPKAGVPRRLELEGELLRGMLSARMKLYPEAVKAFQIVKQSDYRPLAVRASLADVMLKVATGDMAPDKAIEALESLRWQWRGDEVELDLLHKLGSLQIEKGDYRNGLTTLRSATLGFPMREEARTIGDEMTSLFEELFLRGRADSLPPVQALGLYYDFKELTPIGTLGDEMVRKLADRLIGVDLLEQAAELLEHQVDKRLDGVAKAQIAAKLAAVYLMDRKPEKALAAIRNSTQTRLPNELAAHRRLIAARAMSDLKQYDGALESIEQDETPEAARLRSDIYWAASRWTDVAAALETMLKDREASKRPLDATERVDVLKAAIAYTMAEDDKGLASVRERFLPLMSEAAEGAAFAMVTRAVDPGGVALRDIAKSVAAVDTLDLFLKSLGLGRPADGSAAAN